MTIGATPARGGGRSGSLTHGLRQAELLAHRADERVGLSEYLRPLVYPGLAECLHDATKRGHAVALHGGKYVPA